MDTQASSSYAVDNRYRGLKQASDNDRAKEFLDRYKVRQESNLTEDRKEDNRFVVSSPGWGENFEFTNAFGSPRSPAQRRLSRMGQ
jgi:hypothetical protein